MSGVLGAQVRCSAPWSARGPESAGACLARLRDALFADRSCEEVLKEAASSEPGAGSIIFTPWLYGERSPMDDRRALGGFHNLSIAAARADLARSVLEGVALNSRWFVESVDAFAAKRLDPLRMMGGGAQSDLWRQIHTNVMNRRIERAARPLNADLRGAAVFAGLALGAVALDDVRSLVWVDAVFEPESEHRALYDDLFGEFSRLYRAERSMFRRPN